MSYLLVPCSECGEQTTVREFAATRTEPGDVSADTCSDPDCGGDLDWNEAEPISAAELEYDV